MLSLLKGRLREAPRRPDTEAPGGQRVRPPDLREEADVVVGESGAFRGKTLTPSPRFAPEIWVQVFSYLDPMSLARASQTCTQFARFARDSQVDRAWALRSPGRTSWLAWRAAANAAARPAPREGRMRGKDARDAYLHAASARPEAVSRSLRRVPDPLRADLLFLLDDAHTLALPLAGAAACGAAAAGAALLRRGDLDAAGRAFGDMRAQLKQVRRHASGASAPDEIRDIEMRLQREAAPVAISWARWQAQHAAERGKVRDMNLWLRRLAQYERTAGGRPSTNFTQTTRQHGLARGVQVALRGVLRLGAAGEVDAMDRALRTAHRWADANGQQLPDMSAYLRRGYARGAVDAVERGLDRAEPSNARCFSLLSRVAPFQEAELLWQAGAQVDVSMGGAGRLARKARPWLQVEAWGPYAFPMALVFETHAGLEQALGRIRLEPTSVAREVAVVRAQIDDLTKHFPTAAQPRFEEMSARVAQRLGFLAMDKLGYLDRFFGCARTGPLDFAISIWERLPAKAQNLGIDMPLTDLRGILREVLAGPPPWDRWHHEDVVRYLGLTRAEVRALIRAERRERLRARRRDA